MPNQAMLEQIELAEPTQSVDVVRWTSDSLKLPTLLRTLLNTRLAGLLVKDAATRLFKARSHRLWVSDNWLWLLDVSPKKLLPRSFGVRGEREPELAKIGRQPRRASGDAQSQLLPSNPGTATFDATALTLTIPAPPDHATSIRASRKPAGGVAQLVGTSTTNVVSVVDAGPLTADVIYELWLVGHNSQGDGSESNHVTHVTTWQITLILKADKKPQKKTVKASVFPVFVSLLLDRRNNDMCCVRVH